MRGVSASLNSLKCHDATCRRAPRRRLSLPPRSRLQARPGEKRTITRRGLLAAGAALAWAGRVRADDLPPIVFVHGDSDLAATWETVVWRFESNGYPREELFAISFTNPQARGDDTKEQPNCSSTEDKLKVLSAFVDAALAKTGASDSAPVSATTKTQRIEISENP